MSRGLGVPRYMFIPKNRAKIREYAEYKLPKYGDAERVLKKKNGNGPYLETLGV
jgi:hypothetical protein